MFKSYYGNVVGEYLTLVFIILWGGFGISPLDTLIQLLYGLTAVKG